MRRGEDCGAAEAKRGPGRERRLVASVCLGMLAFALGAGGAAARHQAPPTGADAIRAENALPGTTAWLAPEAPGSTIEGYASEVGAQAGDTVHLHVSTQPAARYRVLVYRLGWYGGRGARLLACLPDCGGDESGQPRPVPPPEPATGEVRAGWPVTDTFTIPDTWVSGYYAIQLQLTSGPQQGGAYLVPLIVRAPPGGHAPILVQVPVNTWQAYNSWGGKSLYNFSSTGNVPAVKVSFDRPYATHGTHIQQLGDWELPLVRFLEREGYAVDYQTDVDTDRDPSSLLQHRLVIAAGHGEYWTKGERDAFEAARDSGTNLAFLGANIGYWQVRYEDGGRTLVGYKSLADPVADPAQKTAMFRELTPQRRECDLEGIQHQGGLVNWPESDYAVDPGALADPWFAGTGFDAASRVVDAVSTESDSIPWNEAPPWSCGHTLTILFRHDAGGDTLGNAFATRYVAASGARVFAAGSLQFVWALDDFHRQVRPIATPVDPRVQQFVRNMLDGLTRPPCPLRVRVRPTPHGIRIRVDSRPDPRIRGFVVLRHAGDSSFAPDAPDVTQVCVTGTGRCRDQSPGLSGVYRYEAVAVDTWGTTSAPTAALPITIP